VSDCRCTLLHFQFNRVIYCLSYLRQPAFRDIDRKLAVYFQIKQTTLPYTSRACKPQTQIDYTVLLQNGGSCNGYITERCLQEMCHLMILFYNCSIIKYERNENGIVFCHALNNIGFLMKGKLLRAKSVLWCNRFRIHCYIAAPFPYRVLIGVLENPSDYNGNEKIRQSAALAALSCFERAPSRSLNKISIVPTCLQFGCGMD
jgi:hypothetical protein